MRLIPFAFVIACGGPTAEMPLTVPLGLTHDATDQALRAHQFCRPASRELPSSHQIYPRCDRAGAEISDAWVTATFDGDKLIELRRWERYADDALAVQRWNELVSARIKTSPAIDAPAKLEPGARSMRAFRGEGGTSVGVYLITPSPPENASILEKIVYPQ